MGRRAHRRWSICSVLSIAAHSPPSRGRKAVARFGHAYRDYARTEEMTELRTAAEKAGQPFVYDRRWMALTDAQAQAYEAEGRTAVVRLKMPREGACIFNDVIRGSSRI